MYSVEHELVLSLHHLRPASSPIAACFRSRSCPQTKPGQPLEKSNASCTRVITTFIQRTTSLVKDPPLCSRQEQQRLGCLFLFMLPPFCGPRGWGALTPCPPVLGRRLDKRNVVQSREPTQIQLSSNTAIRCPD
jgi:hypothetical protein